MNKYEQALVDAVRQITKDNAARAASDARWLNGMLRDLAPQMIGQREYKMLVILIKCGGNEALLDALNDTPAAQERAVVRLTQRMADEYVMDETAARRICALYMTAASGNSAYIDRLDAAGEAKRQPAPKPAPAAKKPAKRKATKPASPTDKSPKEAPAPKSAGTPEGIITTDKDSILS